MLDLLAGDHELSAAPDTADLEVHAHAQDEKAVIAAGVRLLHDQFIINVYIHKSLPLNTIPIYYTITPKELWYNQPSPVVATRQTGRAYKSV